MNLDADLQEFLYRHEKYFVDELHRLQTAPELLTLFFRDDPGFEGGWLFMQAEPDSGDWNIARMLGNPEIALACLHLLPDVESYLLIPEGAEHHFANDYRQASSLLWFLNDAQHHDSFALTHEAAAMGFDLNIKMDQSDDSATDSGFAIYLLRQQKVQGYIKTIHSTKNFVEVYIEVKPSLRNRGLGTMLLQQACSLAFSLKRQLIYAVDAENKASIKIALKSGLKQFTRCSRFIRPCNR